MTLINIDHDNVFFSYYITVSFSGVNKTLRIDISINGTNIVEDQALMKITHHFVVKYRIAKKTYLFFKINLVLAFTGLGNTLPTLNSICTKQYIISVQSERN